MANPQLVEWVRQQGAQGYTPEQISSYLVQQGYDANSVNDAMRMGMQTTPAAGQPTYNIPAGPAPKSFSKNLWIIALGIVLLGLCIGGIVYMVSKASPVDGNALDLATVSDASADSSLPADGDSLPATMGGGGPKKSEDLVTGQPFDAAPTDSAGTIQPESQDTASDSS